MYFSLLTLRAFLLFLPPQQPVPSNANSSLVFLWGVTHSGSMSLGGLASILDPVVNLWPLLGLYHLHPARWLVGSEQVQDLVRSTIPGLCPGTRPPGHSRGIHCIREATNVPSPAPSSDDSRELCLPLLFI